MMKKKILLIGNGGRENALAYSIINSPSFKDEYSQIYCTIGSGGLDKLCEVINILPYDIEKLKEFAIEKKIDFTVVGPEVPLSLGIVDTFEKAGLKIFGPNKDAALLETSKIFAKKIMQEMNIPTAKYSKFNRESIKDARDYIKDVKYPVVIKADGLAAGKGVIICSNETEAMETLNQFSGARIFGNSSDNFIIEEFLDGYEMSVFVITDGEDYIILPPSQDHKKIGEGDVGPNTGGMGAYAPLSEKYFDKGLKDKIKFQIIEPLLQGLKKRNIKYKGCLYCGLMITENDNNEKIPYVIEFNCRFGDPESQVVLPLIKSDFLQMLVASQSVTIKNYNLEVYPKFSFCVILASKGYPVKFETGYKISGLDELDKDIILFHSGTKIKDGELITNGGRVLSVVGMSELSLKDAADKVYRNIEKIKYNNKYFRKDIGHQSLK